MCSGCYFSLQVILYWYLEKEQLEGGIGKMILSKHPLGVSQNRRISLIVVPVHESSKLSKLPILRNTDYYLFFFLVGWHRNSHSVLHLGLVMQEKLKTVENRAAVEILQLFSFAVVVLKKKMSLVLLFFAVLYLMLTTCIFLLQSWFACCFWTVKPGKAWADLFQPVLFPKSIWTTWAVPAIKEKQKWILLKELWTKL